MVSKHNSPRWQADWDQLSTSFRQLLLKLQHRRCRLDWCRRGINGAVYDWWSARFSDESCFSRSIFSCIRVWTQRGQRSNSLLSICYWATHCHIIWSDIPYSEMLRQQVIFTRAERYSNASQVHKWHYALGAIKSPRCRVLKNNIWPHSVRISQIWLQDYQLNEGHR